MNNKITYSKVGDYYMPNLVLTGTENEITLGKYGRLRLNYLKQHKKAEYTIMLMDNTLKSHLLEIDETARQRVNLIIEKMAKVDGTDENLKDTDQLKWVGLMNNYRYYAEEIVMNELIYC